MRSTVADEALVVSNQNRCVGVVFKFLTLSTIGGQAVLGLVLVKIGHFV